MPEALNYAHTTIMSLIVVFAKPPVDELTHWWVEPTYTPPAFLPVLRPVAWSLLACEFTSELNMSRSAILCVSMKAAVLVS